MKKALIPLLLILLIISISSCSKKKIKNDTFDKEVTFLELNTYALKYGDEYNNNYNNGVDLAVSEINKKGGINGRKIKIVRKNDYNSYVNSYETVKSEINDNPNILAVFGGYNTQAVMGISRAAENFNIAYLISGSVSDILMFSGKTDYTYRVNPGLYENIAAIVSEAKKIRNLNRWLIVTYSNEEGSYIEEAFKYQLIKHSNSKNLFFENENIAEYRTESSFMDNKDYSLVNAVFIAVKDRDIQNLIDNKALKKRFLGKKVFILFAGEPEWLSFSHNDFTPEGWVTTGYPWYSLNNDIYIDYKKVKVKRRKYKSIEYPMNTTHEDFYNNYFSKYRLQPRYSSILGYTTVYALAETAKKTNLANNTVKDIRKSFNKNMMSLYLYSPLGELFFDKNHQMNLGVFTGSLAFYKKNILHNGKRMLMQDVRMHNIVYYSKYILDVDVDDFKKRMQKIFIKNIKLHKYNEKVRTNKEEEKLYGKNIVN